MGSQLTSSGALPSTPGELANKFASVLPEGWMSSWGRNKDSKKSNQERERVQATEAATAETPRDQRLCGGLLTSLSQTAFFCCPELRGFSQDLGDPRCVVRGSQSSQG